MNDIINKKKKNLDLQLAGHVFNHAHGKMTPEQRKEACEDINRIQAEYRRLG